MGKYIRLVTYIGQQIENVNQILINNNETMRSRNKLFLIIKIYRPKIFINSIFLVNLLFLLFFVLWSILLINHYRYIKYRKRFIHNPYLKFVQTTISPHYNQNQLLDEDIDYNCPDNTSDK